MKIFVNETDNDFVAIFYFSYCKSKLPSLLEPNLVDLKQECFVFIIRDHDLRVSYESPQL